MHYMHEGSIYSEARAKLSQKSQSMKPRTPCLRGICNHWNRGVVVGSRFFVSATTDHHRKRRGHGHGRLRDNEVPKSLLQPRRLVTHDKSSRSKVES